MWTSQVAEASGQLPSLPISKFSHRKIWPTGNCCTVLLRQCTTRVWCKNRNALMITTMRLMTGSNKLTQQKQKIQLLTISESCVARDVGSMWSLANTDKTRPRPTSAIKTWPTSYDHNFFLLLMLTDSSSVQYKYDHGVDPCMDRGTFPPTFWSGGTPCVLSALLFWGRHFLYYCNAHGVHWMIGAIFAKFSQLILMKIIKFFPRDVTF